MCVQARRRTSLEDFGDPPLEPALSVLVNSMEREADLHPLGRFLIRAHLRGLLETRLRLVEAWSGQWQALEASRIEQPIFIVGMPRTGSTFLHELLAEDPANRAPRVWEVMFPLPGRGARKDDSDRRVRKAAACLWWFRHLAPEADAVYPMRAWTPHECVAIQSYTLLSEEFISTCRIPAYEAFLHSIDLRPVYAWQKRFLQHMDADGAANKRWVLKSPDHVQGLEALFAVFPDALIVQTHRNPIEVVRSSIHLTQVLQRLYVRPGDRRQIARREAQVLAERMERFMLFRDGHPELASRFIDLNYSDMVADPLAAVHRIYRRLEMPLAEAAADRMRRLVSTRSRYPRRPRAATPSVAGLEVAREARRFNRYCLRFGIACPQVEMG